MVERCKQNAKISGLADAPIRYIVDDCFKFVEREIRRGKKYDAIIMDPPSYGRGTGGEVWKLEENIADFVKLCSKVLTDKPLFVLINSYTTGLGATAMENILRVSLGEFKGRFDSYEVGIPTKEGLILPCGNSSVFIGEKTNGK
jgi:23S rRNA (cytosine1962-C5)-methyltransferase